MENTIFTNIKKLYDYELYSEVISLGSILYTIYKNDRNILTSEQEYQLLLFQANSYFIERRYSQALPIFREILQAKKPLIRLKNPNLTIIEQNYEHFSENETKYRLAYCLKEVQDPKKAILTLQSIKFRTPKMNMLLAKLQHYNGNDNMSSIRAYKDVLAECPLSLDAIKSLLEIGICGNEVNSIVINTCATYDCSDWLSNWIKGYDQMFNRKFVEAAETFKSINQYSKISNNEKLLTLIGESLYYGGYSESAVIYLANANAINPQMTDCIMPLAVLYAKKNKTQELEKLTTRSIQISEFKSEHWFVIAQHLYLEEKYDRAVYFIQKSITENPRNVEAYILKAKILYQLRKYTSAIMCFKEAQAITNYRFEIYKGLTKCFITMGRLRNAQAIAAHSVRDFISSPRSYVLLAKALLYPKDPALARRAKSFLEKALELEEFYVPAVVTLLEALQAEGNTAEAIRMLRKQVASSPNCKLYTMLGDLLSNEKDLDGALENYTLALNMDPANAQALAGLNAIGNPTRINTKPNDTAHVASASLDEPNSEITSFEMMYEISATGDAESESETFWSDIDVELNP